MDFPSNSGEHLAGYYNLSLEEFWWNPPPIETLEIPNADHVGLYLKNKNLTNEAWETFMPFPDNLQEVNCKGNKFTELPEFPFQLEGLNCENNLLRRFPPLNNLVQLYCGNNKLEEFPEDFVLPPHSLLVFACDNNLLKKLPQLSNTAITRLYCSDNQIEELPDLPPNIKEIHCKSNFLKKIPTIPLTPNLFEYLVCDGNQIKELPALPNNTLILSCERNLLKELPDLIHTKIFSLRCGNNQLKKLPDLPNSLTTLRCNDNNLNSLPGFPDSLRSLFCRGNNFDEKTLDRIITFYRKAISEGFRDVPREPFQVELEHFIELKNIKTNQSVSNVALLQQTWRENLEEGVPLGQEMKPIPKGVLSKITEYANLNEPKNPYGGRRNKKKTSKKKSNKKTKTTKKPKKTRKMMSKKSNKKTQIKLSSVH
jgi:hypothetical protein